jgi:hypothetical protein
VGEKNKAISSSPLRRSKPLSDSYVKIMTGFTFHSYSMLNPKVVNDLLPHRVNIHPPPRTKKKIEKEKEKGK